MRKAEGVTHHLPRALLGVGRHGIFEVENERIGKQGFGFVEASGIGLGHEEDTVAGMDDPWHVSLTLPLSQEGKGIETHALPMGEGLEVCVVPEKEGIGA